MGVSGDGENSTHRNYDHPVHARLLPPPSAPPSSFVGETAIGKMAAIPGSSSLIIPAGGAALHDWPFQEQPPGSVSPLAALLSPPSVRKSELSAGSLSLPYDIRSQQLFRGILAGSFVPKAAPALKDLGTPFSHQVVMNAGPVNLDAVKREVASYSKMTPQEILDAKALAASKSHSEAERRRRERINTHLATLRSLLPSSTKTDKASLLAEVIEYVKDLKRQAAEIAEGGPVPTDVDELRVDPHPSQGEGTLLIRASICCDDRPDLLPDLIRTLRNLRLKTVRAEFATLGGRVKNVILVTRREEGIGEEREESLLVNYVQEALKMVLERPGSVGDLSPGSSGGHKRQRITSQIDSPPSPQALDQSSI